MAERKKRRLGDIATSAREDLEKAVMQLDMEIGEGLSPMSMGRLKRKIKATSRESEKQSKKASRLRKRAKIIKKTQDVLGATKVRGLLKKRLKSKRLRKFFNLD